MAAKPLAKLERKSKNNGNGARVRMYRAKLNDATHKKFKKACDSVGVPMTVAMRWMIHKYIDEHTVAR